MSGSALPPGRASRSIRGRECGSAWSGSRTAQTDSGVHGIATPASRASLHPPIKTRPGARWMRHPPCRHRAPAPPRQPSASDETPPGTGPGGALLPYGNRRLLGEIQKRSSERLRFENSCPLGVINGVMRTRASQHTGRGSLRSGRPAMVRCFVVQVQLRLGTGDSLQAEPDRQPQTGERLASNQHRARERGYAAAQIPASLKGLPSPANRPAEATRAGRTKQVRWQPRRAPGHCVQTVYGADPMESSQERRRRMERLAESERGPGDPQATKPAQARAGLPS